LTVSRPIVFLFGLERRITAAHAELALLQPDFGTSCQAASFNANSGIAVQTAVCNAAAN